MESNIHSNFIPHDTMTPSRARRGSAGMFDLFMLLSIVLFVASATLAVGVFLYVQYLTSSSKSKVDQLERAKAAFEPSLILDLTRLDDRMRAADTILTNHIAPTAIFRLLERLTLQSVSFTSFDLSASAANEMKLTMQGLAETVNSIALQADYLSRSGAITSPVFSNINRQRDGIRFDFEADVTPSALRYREALFGAAAGSFQQGAPQQESAAPAETSPFGAPPPTPMQPRDI